MDFEKPVYPIGVVSEILGVHPRTLRIWEIEGLVKPSRRGGKRFYSDADLTWLRAMRKLLSEERLNLTGIKRMLQVAPSWEATGLPEDAKTACPLWKNKA
jgi:DNA-binding transcriptional MerR regulator